MPKTALKPAAVNQWKKGTLSVVEDLCRFSADNARADIVIRSDHRQLPMAIEEIQSMDARNLATAYASAHGMGDARLNGSVNYYAINADDEPVELEMKDDDGEVLPPRHARRQVAAYLGSVPVTRKLI